jgi:hypothetical protein
MPAHGAMPLLILVQSIPSSLQVGSVYSCQARACADEFFHSSVSLLMVLCTPSDLPVSPVSPVWSSPSPRLCRPCRTLGRVLGIDELSPRTVDGRRSLCRDSQPRFVVTRRARCRLLANSPTLHRSWVGLFVLDGRCRIHLWRVPPARFAMRTRLRRLARFPRNFTDHMRSSMPVPDPDRVHICSPSSSPLASPLVLLFAFILAICGIGQTAPQPGYVPSYSPPSYKSAPAYKSYTHPDAFNTHKMTQINAPPPPQPPAPASAEPTMPDSLVRAWWEDLIAQYSPSPEQS